jgi:hypothetical protein
LSSLASDAGVTVKDWESLFNVGDVKTIIEDEVLEEGLKNVAKEYKKHHGKDKGYMKWKDAYAMGCADGSCAYKMPRKARLEEAQVVEEVEVEKVIRTDFAPKYHVERVDKRIYEDEQPGGCLVSAPRISPRVGRRY